MIDELRIQILSKHTLLDQVLLLLAKKKNQIRWLLYSHSHSKTSDICKIEPQWILRIIITIKATIYLYKIYIKRTYIKHL